MAISAGGRDEQSPPSPPPRQGGPRPLPPLLPVLIVPGIMSSGLEVRKSGISESHEGRRVWMNPASLGFGALYIGRALERTTVLTRVLSGGGTSVDDGGDGDEDDDSSSDGDDGSDDSGDSRDGDDDDESTNDGRIDAARGSKKRLAPPGRMTRSKYEEQVKCKSSWLHHLTLEEDGLNEREGNEVRPIPGLDGVDFLTDIATVKVGASYVFGPVIKMLLAAGYTRGVNMDAVPYDWRIPPSLLEERDGYFTATMDRIERMYHENGGTPVVLLCHSMGCKVGHYLLNFAMHRRRRSRLGGQLVGCHGREWIDKYVHTYMPVGGPHLGAPSTIASAFSGVSLSPMVDPMLSLEEKLVFARSLGSGPWVMPRILPPNAFPNLIRRREGCLEISIRDPIGDLDALVRTKRGTQVLRKIRLCVDYGDNRTMHSRYATPRWVNKKDGVRVKIGESFLFSTPPILEDGSIQFFLREKGSQNVRERQKSLPRQSVRILREKSQYALTAIRYRDRDEMGKMKMASKSRLLASSMKETLCAETLASRAGHEMDVPITFFAHSDTSIFTNEPKQDTRSLIEKIFGKEKVGARRIKALIHIRWRPPPTQSEDKAGPPIAELSESTISTMPPLPLESKNNTSHTYEPGNGQAVLREEGLQGSLLSLTHDRYEHDPLGPRTLSAVEAPPVNRVYAIYGVNSPTTVGSICCRSPALVSKEGRVKPRYMLDESAQFVVERIKDPAASAIWRSYEIDGGEVKETRDTPQKELGSGRVLHCSGDGTVPYWSLQQPKVWQSPKCQVRVEEVEGAEHRAILADKRFHKMLLDYLGGKECIELYEAEAARTLQMFVRKVNQVRVANRFLEVAEAVAQLGSDAISERDQGESASLTVAETGGTPDKNKEAPSTNNLQKEVRGTETLDDSRDELERTRSSSGCFGRYFVC